MCQKGHKHTEKAPENQSNKIKRGHFYSSAFKIQNFAQFVENVAQTCVCVSATFRNSGGRVQRTRVDWEGLVETVFAEEVGDFILQAQGKK